MNKFTEFIWDIVHGVVIMVAIAGGILMFLQTCGMLGGVHG